jgi:CTD kinase subunit gamma CTK3 C-terminus
MSLTLQTSRPELRLGMMPWRKRKANPRIVKVLSNMSTKHHIGASQLDEVYACLSERDSLINSSPSAKANGTHISNLPRRPGSDGSNQSSESAKERAAAAATMPTPGAPTSRRPDKRQIEQRIEEDRERHKRLREGMWAVLGDEKFEFDRMWSDLVEADEDDKRTNKEDRGDRKAMAYLKE